ncbi:outer membrane protein [Methylocapsa acidiphila]|uniref:outer membrane protein n=1 Tax=Methylocapsa acidiphila TaxID=133552 RepID=UPI00042372BD|nr:outer membrane protein [Methylocapsa acidiphila]
MIRKLLLASVGAVALAGSAVAADLPSRAPPPVYVPPVPIFTWTGVYIGGQIGYAWTNNNVSWNGNYGDAAGDYIFSGFSNRNLNNNGVIGGAHVGYNLQLGQWVLGLEGDVDGSSLSKTVNVSGWSPYYNSAIGANVTTNLGIQGSIRGRVGVAWDRVLLYGTGGVAFGGFSGNVNSAYGWAANGTIYSAYNYSGRDSLSSTRVGWTVGGGLEYAVTNNWSVRAEYRYTDFGRYQTNLVNSFVFPSSVYGNTWIQRHVSENRVQVGFSYKFDSYAPAPVVAKY